MSVPIIAAGIQAGANVLNNGANIVYNELTHNRDLREQIEAENRANDEWTRRFNKENEYNTPALQSQRLKEAGINPIAALSGSAPTPSASGSTNTPDSPRTNSVDIKASNSAALYLDAKRLENETKISDAQARLIDAQTQKTLTDESMAYWEQQWKQNEDARQERLVALQEKLGNEKWRIDKVAADLAEYSFDNKKAMSDQEVEQMYLDYAIGMWQIEHTKQDIAESQAVVQDYADQAVTRSIQRALMKSNIELNEQQCKELVSRCAKMDEETKLILKQQGKTDAEIAKIQAESQQIEAYTKEIPKNARAQRYGTYVDSTVGGLTKIANTAIDVYSAIGTGGVSKIVSNIVTNPSSTPEGRLGGSIIGADGKPYQ